MFTKKKLVGSASVHARKYKTVIDWNAVGATCFWGSVILLIISFL